MSERWSSEATVTSAARSAFEAGHVLRELHVPQELWRTFPLRVRLVGPDREEMVARLGEVRSWSRTLGAAAEQGSWSLLTKSVTPRGLGRQTVPAAAVFDSPGAALAACSVAQQRTAQTFAELLEMVGPSVVLDGRADEVVAAAGRLLALARPFEVLEAGQDWPLLLKVAMWLRANPRPGIAVRQVPVDGMHTKVVESRRKLLRRLLDATLPAEAVDAGADGFADRYGFRRPVRRVRLRGSGRALGLQGVLAGAPHLAQDAVVTWPVSALGALEPAAAGVHEVLVCENELSFATVPLPPGRLVVWGAGGGVGDLLAGVPWLSELQVRYWGDIDTHGFALLAQLRRRVPHVHSVLMDEATLLAHRAHWVRERTPALADLPQLTGDEAAVFNGLRSGVWGAQVRLEQEFIRFDLVEAALH